MSIDRGPVVGIRAYDLEVPPKSLAATMLEPRPCRVCGKERPGLTPLRSLFDRGDRPHADCDRQVAEWERQAATAADKDPDYIAAVEAAEAAQAKAVRIWEAKVRALGLPDWIVERALASHQQGWRDE